MKLDPTFYRKIYPDLRFIVHDIELHNHWKYSGQVEGRIGSEQQLRDFVSSLPYPFEYKVYQQYPDVPSNELDCLVHFYMHGFKEGRVYNNAQLNDQDSKLEQQIFLESTEYGNPEPVQDISKRINILVRTHARDKMFKACITSILKQTYKNFHIYICIQSAEDLLYVNKHILGSEKVTIIKGYSTEGNFQHNDYCNQLIDLIQSGWIIFLDDDDQFTTTRSLEIISKYIKKGVIVLWKYKRPDALIFPDPDQDLHHPGSIASTSYCIHHEVAKMSKWASKRQGDFDFIKPIYNTLKREPIDRILTKYQLQDQVASFGKNL